MTETVLSLLEEFWRNFRVADAVDMPPLSGAGKHHNFQVTSCLHFVTTDADFAYIKSE